MYYWRITKYKPQYRENVKYVNSEWTAITDVGKYFNDVEFKFEEYLEYEKKYIMAITLAMLESNIDNFVIEELEKNEYKQYDDLLEPRTKEVYDSLKAGARISSSEIGIVVQLILREMVWGKLVNNETFIHFGYDYYMYFGFEKELKKTREEMQNTGVFIEEMKSPYLD